MKFNRVLLLINNLIKEIVSHYDIGDIQEHRKIN